MIKINNKEYKIKHFPDNSQMHMDFNISEYLNTHNSFYIEITWLYENDEEMVSLYYIVNHLRRVVPGNKIGLKLPYCPNSRMDRVKSENEIFTLKYFCNFINSLNFTHVYVFDTHSYITDALLDNIINLHVGSLIYRLYSTNNYDLIYFPDAGAMKRYSQYFKNNPNMVYGSKVRDWNTGKIEGIKILNKDGEPCDKSNIENKSILMVDDIISYGGTMAYSADKLHELGAKNIDIYVSHLENSFFDEEKGTLRKRMKNGTNIVNAIYTTNSIYKEENNEENFNIKLIHKF